MSADASPRPGDGAADGDDAKIRRLPWALLSAALGSVYGNLGAVLVLYYDELGLPKTHIGLLNALIFLPGPLALFVAPLAARWGFKRTYLTFYSTRKVVFALLAASPFVLHQTGLAGVMVFTVAVMGTFGVLRVIAETAFYPWAYEFVPRRVRGQFSAINNIVSTVFGLGVVAWMGHFLSEEADLQAYQVLVLLAASFGLLSVLVKMPIRGGESQPESVSQRAHFSLLREALRDAPFRRFLWGLVIISLATHAWGAFIPLYLKDEVGLDAGTIVQMQTFLLIGTLVSSYAWGWLADRFSGRLVLLSGVLAMGVLPLIWVAMPRHSELGIFWAAVAAALWGGGSIGFSIGQDRQLNVDLVPAKKKTEYMALFYTWTQIAAVVSPLLTGWGLDQVGALRTELFGFPVGPYTPFFTFSFVGIVAGALVFWRAERA